MNENLDIEERINNEGVCSMKRMSVYIAVGVVVVVSVGYYVIGNGSAEPAPAEVGQVVRYATVTKGNLDLTVSANGVVRPIDQVEIRSKASGLIEKLNFEEGQLVEKGNLLIELDRRTAQNDYDQAKADLAVGESNLKQAENNYNRSIELFQKSLISEQERDQSQLDKVRAEAQLIKAKAALSSSDERLRDTRIIAPITGLILTRNVALGQIISSATSNVSGGSLLATIADMDEVYVETNVDEVDIGKVQVSQQAKVVADAFPDDTFNGEVMRISPLGKTASNVTTFTVVILVRNIGGKLKAGMSASVDIEIIRKRDVLLVPAEALKDPRSEAGRALLASVKQPEAEKTDSGKTTATKTELPTDPAELQRRMASMSPEEQQKAREQMREQFQKMSPEQRQQYFSRMQGSGGGQQGGGMFRRDVGGSRRPSQRQNQEAVKNRVIEVKENGAFVVKMVKVGASNFDFAEVIDGLKEGDEIRIVAVSRALLSSEQFNERMRNMSSMGGGNIRVGR